MKKQFFVYILAKERNGTLYVGITSELVRRVWEHKEKVVESFTKKYEVNRLVYYEVHESADAAITREKRLKKWNRAWKLRLIEGMNPSWRDLWQDIAQ